MNATPMDLYPDSGAEIAAGMAPPDTTAMVGDRLYTDMQMAYNAGTVSVLLLSGETKRADLDTVERRPDFVFESARDLYEALRSG